MSTLAEIEAAVDSLTADEMEHLETFLRARRARAQEKHLQELHRRIGLHPLPRHGDAVITNEMVQQLREEEDIF